MEESNYRTNAALQIKKQLLKELYKTNQFEEINKLREDLVKPELNKMWVLHDFLEKEHLTPDGKCVYCSKLPLPHTENCIYPKIVEVYSELYDLGFRTHNWKKGEDFMEKLPKSVNDRLNKVRDFFGLENVVLEDVKADTLLMKSAEKFRSKNAEHGDAYLKVGVILNQLFPEGITLKTINEFNKFTTLIQILYKVTRMCNTCFNEKELIHDSEFDSPNDLGIYAHIFGEIQIKEVLEKNAGKLQ
jgi:hypothetical protein